MCRRSDLKVNTYKSKVMTLNGEEGLESEVHVDVINLSLVNARVLKLECVGACIRNCPCMFLCMVVRQ